MLPQAVAVTVHQCSRITDAAMDAITTVVVAVVAEIAAAVVVAVTDLLLLLEMIETFN